jgi:hypothetical protein
MEEEEEEKQQQQQQKMGRAANGQSFKHHTKASTPLTNIQN